MKLATIFSDGAVFQRGRMVPVWGRTAPLTVVKATFNGHEAFATSSYSGDFMLRLSPEAAGGPYELCVEHLHGECEPVIVRDIFVGEVWVASGQSNMYWKLSKNPEQMRDFISRNRDCETIRFFQQEPLYALGAIEHDLHVKWRKAVSGNAPDFSAVALEFAWDLREKLNVPVGILCAAWGGTEIESWTSENTLSSDSENRKKLDAYVSSLNRAERWDKINFSRWLHEDSPDPDTIKEWATPEFDDSNWHEMSLPGDWIRTGINENGATWIRKTIVLPQSWNGRTLILETGGIDKGDITFFNGKEIGRTGGGFNTGYWDVPRHYRIPGELAAAGINLLAIRAFSFADDGGFVGMPEQYRIYPADSPDEGICFAGTCKAKAEYGIGRVVNSGNAEPGPGNEHSPHILFDGMINPLIPYGIRGAIWYQGEQDAHNRTDAESYRRKLADLIRDWRFHWAQGNFPFIYAQLPNYGEPSDYAPENFWAVMRESQRKVLSEAANAYMAVLLGLGEANNVHPTDKRSVGERMSRQALHYVYGFKDIIPGGPVLKRMYAEDGALVIEFEYANGLHLDGEHGFYIASQNGNFKKASVTISGGRLMLHSPEVSEPSQVRYAWAGNPPSALYNSARLPASPFYEKIGI